MGGLSGTGLILVAGVVVGLALIAAGLWVVRLSKRDIRADGAHDNSTPTRLTVGLTLLFWGYHAIVWALPVGLRPISIPLSWWWLAVGIGVLAVAGSRLAEWLEDRAEG